MTRRERKNYRAIDRMIESGKESVYSNILINPRF